MAMKCRVARTAVNQWLHDRWMECSQLGAWTKYELEVDRRNARLDEGVIRLTVAIIYIRMNRTSINKETDG